MGLFNQASGTASPEQQRLALIARTAPNWGDRSEAVKKLTDQTTLAYVVLNDTDRFVCKQAIKRLTDQQILYQVILSLEKDNFKACNPGLITRTGGNAQYCELLHLAASMLTDQKLLAKVLMNCKQIINLDSGVVAGLDSLSDRKLLADVAKHSKDSYIRKAANKKLSEEPVSAAEPTMAAQSKHAVNTYSDPDFATHVRMATNDLCSIFGSAMMGGNLASQRDWIRNVGLDLYETHGFGAMQEVFQNVKSRYDYLANTQLSPMWDGIGDWAD